EHDLAPEILGWALRALGSLRVVGCPALPRVVRWPGTRGDSWGCRRSLGEAWPPRVSSYGRHCSPPTAAGAGALCGGLGRHPAGPRGQQGFPPSPRARGGGPIVPRQGRRGAGLSGLIFAEAGHDCKSLREQLLECCLGHRDESSPRLAVSVAFSRL